MTRRRLWTLTALTCLVLALPSAAPAAGSVWRTAGAPALELFAQVTGAWLRQLPPPNLRDAPIALAAVSMLLAATLLIRRQRRPAAERATRLARDGRPVPEIARRTGLAQDAVRDLLGGEPMAVSTAIGGRFFRRPRTSAPPSADAFAAELEEKSFDASA